MVGRRSVPSVARSCPTNAKVVLVMLMSKVTKISVKKCNARDELTDAVCNEPKEHGPRHYYKDGKGLEVSWNDVENPKITGFRVHKESDIEDLLGHNLAGDCS